MRNAYKEVVDLARKLGVYAPQRQGESVTHDEIGQVLKVIAMLVGILECRAIQPLTGMMADPWAAIVDPRTCVGRQMHVLFHIDRSDDKRRGYLTPVFDVLLLAGQLIGDYTPEEVRAGQPGPPQA